MTLTVLYKETFDAALDAQWTRQGVATETIANGQLSATLAPGQGYTRLLSDCNLGALTDCTVELALQSDSNLSSMVGALAVDDGGTGTSLCWYNNPNGLLYLTASNWTYPGGFATAFSMAPVFPNRIRLRKAGNVWYASYSTDDGATWSAEATGWTHAANPTRVGFGNVQQTTSANVVVNEFVVLADLNPTVQPANLAAVGFEGGVSVSWSSDPNAQSYQYRLNAGAWQTVTTPRATITGLTDGTSYTIDVQSVNSLGTSAMATIAVTPEPSLLFDDFNRADSTTSPGAPTQGGPYTVRTGTFGIQGARLYTPVSTADSQLTFPVAADFDMTVRLDVAGNDIGLVFRWADANNTWMLEYTNNGFLHLYRRKSGTWNKMANDIPRTLNAGDSLRVVALGEKLWCFCNDLMIFAEEDEYFSAETTICGFRFSGDTTSRIGQAVVKVATAVPFAISDGSMADDVFAPPMATPNDQVLLYKGRDSLAEDQGAVA